MLRVLVGMMSCIPGVCRSVHVHVHRGQRQQESCHRSATSSLRQGFFSYLATNLAAALGSLPSPPRCCGYRCWWHPPTWHFQGCWGAEGSQVLKFVWYVVYPLSHLPNPRNKLFMKINPKEKCKLWKILINFKTWALFSEFLSLLWMLYFRCWGHHSGLKLKPWHWRIECLLSKLHFSLPSWA